MIGLPSETEEDVRGIAELSARVVAAAGGRLRVTASVSTFSPKPHTPFQWAGQLSLEETRVRQALLRHELGRRKIEFRWHDARLSLLEGILARGDRRLADVIETAQRRGARFDGWSEHCRLEVWSAAMAAHGLDPQFYLRRRPLEEKLPWDHLDAGVSRKFLLQDLARALTGVLTPDCSIERCTYCGACDFEAVRNVDYHPEGAKGSDHRGHEISRWADLAVPAEDDPSTPAWETKAWREARARLARRREAARPRPPLPEAVPLPEPLASEDGAAPAATPPETVAARLAAELPEGLEPVGAAEVSRAAPSIDAGIAAFVYEVDLAALDRPPAPDAVAAALARFAGASSFPLRKHTRSGERTVDARRFVRSLEMTAPQRLPLELAVGPEGTVKPGALLGELLAIPPEEVPTLRVHKVATRFRAGAA